MRSLSITESRRLIELESVIQRGKQTFVEVGLALAEIRASKLYEIDHESFDEYCRAKWGWEKRYWQYVISAADTVNALPEPSRTMVHTERQARELAKAAPEHRVQVLEQVAAQGPVTARAIQEAITGHEAAQEKKRPKKAKVTDVQDVPANDEAAELVEELNVAREDIKVVLDKLEDGEVFGIEPETLQACADELTKVASMLRRMAKTAKPSKS